MAMLDEQLVEEWINREGYFTMRGVKSGIDEIDLLALKLHDDVPDFLHIEVQISYRPMGYLGGTTSAKARTPAQVKEGVYQWIEKKFTGEKKQAMRKAIAPNANWRFMLVCANLREEQLVLSLLQEKEENIIVVRYHEVLRKIAEEKKHTSASVASDIAELIRYHRVYSNGSSVDPIQCLIGAATRSVKTEDVMRTTRGKNWNKP